MPESTRRVTLLPKGRPKFYDFDLFNQAGQTPELGKRMLGELNYTVFDTETTGLPKRWDAPASDTDNWPRCVQIAWQLHDEMGGLIEQFDTLVKPEGFNIPYDAEQIHGISTDLALRAYRAVVG